MQNTRKTKDTELQLPPCGDPVCSQDPSQQGLPLRKAQPKAQGSLITENKSKRSLCTAESAGGCSSFHFPEERLKCKSTAEQQRLVFVGGPCCFPEKTREPRTCSTDFSVLIFPSLLKLNLTKVQAVGDALNHTLIFHILFENKRDQNASQVGGREEMCHQLKPARVKKRCWRWQRSKDSFSMGNALCRRQEPWFELS